MKHPILYRSVFYSVLLGLCLTIVFLLSLMNEAPFRSVDMRNSYMYGCQFGSRPLTNEKIAECLEVSDLYKETLDDLGRQMEKLSEEL